MSTFISGGCKNGKSFFAQRIAKAGGTPLYYIATMIPRDGEDEERIRRHRNERAGWGFETLECGRDILACLSRADPRGAFLLDSVTALLSNEMFDASGVHPRAAQKIACELAEFVRRAPNTVLVSDFIYSDAAIYDPLTEAYRAGLAHIDRRLARCCDNVLEVVSGQIIVHKGGVPL
ncbi:MAG: bifunctional adenosylcobinamide kinase/adenosylcobinamide-phosphate guanylyltransferase [Clostridia bacterium]|nr:bifunctional adenosylcobinamide kinase/adenosylcobinamide-phosphate guanylyltransferase [Clostridia bacterium]